ncbi:5083_t:CDS:2, partial [Cetraspora pellucida]
MDNCQVLLLVDNALSHFHNQPSTHETHESNESNSDLDEETSNNSELESANNSHDNHSKHDKHSTDRSKGHYGSGYNQVIVNCWRKTRILSSVSREEIEVAIKNQDMLLEQQEEDVNDLVIDLISQDPEIKSQLNTYLDLSDLHIITEEKLEDLKIIEI